MAQVNKDKSCYDYKNRGNELHLMYDIREAMANISPKERVQLMKGIVKGFCQKCGDKKPCNKCVASYTGREGYEELGFNAVCFKEDS